MFRLHYRSAQHDKGEKDTLELQAILGMTINHKLRRCHTENTECLSVSKT